jgi:hypothetical protein
MTHTSIRDHGLIASLSEIWAGSDVPHDLRVGINRHHVLTPDFANILISIILAAW